MQTPKANGRRPLGNPNGTPFTAWVSTPTPGNSIKGRRPDKGSGRGTGTERGNGSAAVSGHGSGKSRAPSALVDPSDSDDDAVNDQDTRSGHAASGNAASGNAVSGNAVSGVTASANSAPNNTASSNAASANIAPGPGAQAQQNAVTGRRYPDRKSSKADTANTHVYEVDTYPKLKTHTGYAKTTSRGRRSRRRLLGRSQSRNQSQSWRRRRINSRRRGSRTRSRKQGLLSARSKCLGKRHLVVGQSHVVEVAVSQSKWKQDLLSFCFLQSHSEGTS
jgi:hypothetical protein